MIRVMIIEEMGLLRAALAAVLSQERDMEVVAELARTDEALAVAVRWRPDVLVIEIDLTTAEPVSLLHRIGAELPDCAIVVLTQHRTPAAVRRALQARARGFLGKDLSPAELLRLVRSVARGERVIDPAAALAALHATNNPLTAREREVLRVVADGLTTGQAAARLYLARGTVRNHLAAAARKLSAGSRFEAVQRAREAGWL